MVYILCVCVYVDNKIFLFTEQMRKPVMNKHTTYLKLAMPEYICFKIKKRIIFVCDFYISNYQ